MKNRGFTLIELLAVIVILAIIALIAVPIVLGIIDNAKESSRIRSAEMYLKGVEQAVMSQGLKKSGNLIPTACTIVEEGNLNCDTSEEIIEVDVKGETPSDGNIRFEEGKIVEARLKYDNEVIVMNNDSKLVMQDENFLANAILRDNEAKADTNINFAQISSDTNGKGLYYTNKNTQDNQTSYYFRGDVDNNYVKFGTEKACSYKGVKVIYLKGIDPEDNMPILDIRPTEEMCNETTVVCDVGSYIKDNYGDNYRYVIGDESFAAALGGNAAVCSMFGGTLINEKATYDEVDVYWKIVRINEDGSIRLIYQGNEPTIGRGEATIGESAFNEESGDNAHVGYMYGKVGSTTYEETHQNINDSTIKKKLDNWYSKNLTGYSNYIADSGFCNDRSITAAGGGTKLGYGTNYTNYKAWERMYSYKPQFACPQKNDLFTVNNGKGNQVLTYPVGLLTIDEAAYAGGVGWPTYGETQNNPDFYLNNGTWYWTMTPNDYADYSSYEPYERFTAGHWFVHGDGYLYGNWAWYDSGDVRPVINLKSNVEITEGNGTVTTPYIVKTN